jgi:MoaA/NifB/PqqE/SkfB family radical SAM enzyme
MGLLPQVPRYIVSRRLGRPRWMPVNLTLTPSARCNSRCLTCNIWQRRDDEMTLQEWEAVLRSIGPTPYWVTVSGGEPFLYQGLVEFAGLIHTYLHPSIINFPCNSLPSGRIRPAVERILGVCPTERIVVNLSLDGVGEEHDRIRGVPGAFSRFQEAYGALRELSRQETRLSIGIHTVISTYNVDHIAQVFDFALASEPDSFVTEIAEERVELGTMGAGITPDVDAYTGAINALLDRMAQQRFQRVGRLTRAFRTEYYGMVKRLLREDRQLLPCYAGYASAQIYCDGNVWPCCVRAESMGNLRNADHDFRRIWFSPTANQMRRSMIDRRCHCPLANAAYTNMLMHPPTLARVLVRLASAGLFRPGPKAGA